MGTFVTSQTTALADLLPDGEKSTAPGVSYRPGWTSDNVLRASEVNAIANALLDVRTEIRARVDVTHYGALGDGATDDTAAFEAAIAAANGTGIVYVPGGTYVVADVDVAIANTALEGESRDLAVLKLKALSSGDGSAILDVAAANVAVRNLTLDGNKANQSADGFHDSYNNGTNGLGRAYRALVRSTSGGSGLTVEGCRLRNAYGACVATNDADYVTVRNCIARDNNFEPVFVYGTASYGGTTYLRGHIVEGLDANGSKSGHASVNSNCVLIRKSKDVRVSCNTLVDQERNAVKFEHCRDFVMADNVIRGVTVAGFGGIALWGSALNGIVRGNVLTECSAGINLPFNNSGLGVENVEISHNVFDSVSGPTTGDAIEVATGHPFVRNLVITGNAIKSPQRNGMRLRGIIERLVVVGNTVSTAGDVACYVLVDGGNLTDARIVGNHMTTSGTNGALRFERLAGETLARVVVVGNALIGTSAVNEVSAAIVTSGTWAANMTSGTVTLRGAWLRDWPLARVLPTYGNPTNIDASLGDFFEIVVTDGVAFQVAAPTNPQTNQEITIRIKNTSGGATGLVSWSGAFKLSAWTSPATGYSRSITFRYDGSNWIEVARTAADVAN